MLANFFKGAAKIAVAIILAAVALAALGFAWVRMSDRAKEREAAPYETVKNWQADTGELLGMKLAMKTKLVGGRMYASVGFDGYPAYLSDPVAKVRNADRVITVIFNDKDGFKIFEKPIMVREFTSIVGPGAQPTGLEYDFSDFVPLADYARFDRLTVTWTMETKVIPPMVPPAAVATAQTGDHCAPNLSRAERLKRLGRHGTVRQTGYETYSAGGSSVSFAFSGSSDVMSCN